MKQIAIDVVLLPDEGIQRLCRQFNAELSSKKIDFNNTRKTPHVSLLMGIINVKNLKDLEKITQKVINNIHIIQFSAELENDPIQQTGEKLWYYSINKNDIPKYLYSELKKSTQNILSYKNISKEMFFQSEEIEDISITWVKGFENRTIKEYSSHITLGIGEFLGEKYTNIISFSTPKIAVFQLGNYCTCANKLFEINL